MCERLPLKLVWPVVGAVVTVPAHDELPAPISLDVARRRASIRLVPRPLAYCRPDNDQGR